MSDGLASGGGSGSFRRRGERARPLKRCPWCGQPVIEHAHAEEPEGVVRVGMRVYLCEQAPPSSVGMRA